MKSNVANLAAIRQARGMTQAELGAAVGVGEMQVSHYEAGRRNPTMLRLIAIADALGVTVDDLLREQKRGRR